MKFSINRIKLLEELNKANKIIDTRNINPAFSGIFLEASVDRMVVISTNGTLAFKSILNNVNSDLDINIPGKVLIKPKYVLETLRRSEEEFVNFSVIEDSELKITTDHAEFNINILDADDYPMLGFREKGIVLEIDPREFKKTINQTIVTVDEYNKKLSLTGLNLKVQNNEVIISGTDTFRISQRIIKLEESFDELVNITIPFKTIVELPKLLDNARKLKIILSDGYVTFSIDSVLFQSNLIDGQFPNVSQAFPKEFAQTLIVDSKSFLKALNRADLPNDDGLPPIINLRIENGKIFIKSTISEIGNYEEEFENFKTTDDLDLQISFNAKFLTDAIKTFDSEQIELKFNDSIKPLVVQRANDETLKQVILPTFLGN
ncbi:DNA polymerase III subunit beta [Mesoplasma photuris]|uniref:DNA polymerase III subunit beta n=1 Tax=Mesoplasma photuris TaxID=217731 RepID=UPI0004E10CE8|nr:DNA polymerase III subunit beta [Mesoplasma photuris]